MNIHKNVVIKKVCHSRKLLSGIYNALKNTRWGSPTKTLGDDANEYAGRTALFFKEEALNKNAFRAPLRSGFILRPSSSRSVSMRDIGAALRGFTTRGVLPQGRYAGYSGRTGFTLIELLVVVLIIGILAAVAVPQYQKAVYKSRYASLKNLTRSLANAEELFYMANGTYTINLNELDIETPFSSVDDTKETYVDYIFDGGFCRLSVVEAYAFTKCRNNSAGMDYQIYFNHSKNSGTRVCVVLNDNPNSMQAQICKQETGKDTHTASGTNWQAYEY